MHAMQCKILQPLGSYGILSASSQISLHICKLSIFLHISSTWSPVFAVLVAQTLLFPHKGVAPPNFIETQVPCQSDSFFGKCIKMMQHASACSAIKILEALGSFQHPFKCHGISEDFSKVSSNLFHLVCTFCCVGGKSLAISTQGVALSIL